MGILKAETIRLYEVTTENFVLVHYFRGLGFKFLSTDRLFEHVFCSCFKSSRLMFNTTPGIKLDRLHYFFSPMNTHKSP